MKSEKSKNPPRLRASVVKRARRWRRWLRWPLCWRRRAERAEAAADALSYQVQAAMHINAELRRTLRIERHYRQLAGGGG